nr:twin-arginine translocase subunit TatC [uncultured Rhodoferax sp.]
MASDNHPQDELAGTEQPFVQHLMELRDRLLYSIYGIAVATLLLAIWPGPARLMDFVVHPIAAHLPPGTPKIIAIGVISPFFIPLKILMLAAVLLALPWLIYQVWQFVAPGLYKHEKNFVLPLILMGSLLAYGGMAFVQFFVLDRVFAFVQQFTPASVQATPDIANAVEFILSMYIAFGAAFQVPVVVILVARMGIVSIEKLKAFRSYFIVLAFVVAAVVTPPDVVSQLALAIPMCILYEIGIWAAQIFIKHTQAPSEEAPTPDAS